MKIRFGTSGWRALISEDFTFDNVRLLSQAIANYLKKNNKTKGIIAGYDVRFLSEDFAKEAGKVIASNGIDVFYPKSATPTPVVSFNVLNKDLSGAIIISASHNPPEYNGYKFSTESGAPSTKEITSEIEKELSKISESDVKLDEEKAAKRIKEFDASTCYFKHLNKILDTESMKKHKMKVAVDCMNGIVTGYLDRFLEDLGYDLKVLNKERDPTFGGRSPDPLPENLEELISIVKDENFDLGLSVDGDADRFGVVDREGEFIFPNQLISLVFYYLANTRKGYSKVARSVSTTHLIDKIAADYGLEVEETPIGFKYIGRLLATGEYIMGAEESGGLSIGGHTPEKDGILSDLLIVELLSYYKKPLKEIFNDIYEKYGTFYNKRINIKVDRSKQKKIMKELIKSPPERIADSKIVTVNTLDGYKYIMDNGDWLMFRASGTEPVIRCYFESSNEEKFKIIEKEATEMINSIS